MAFEKRAHSKNLYYTHSRKVGGRVERFYFGTGAAGEAAYEAFCQKRAALQAERDKRRRTKSAFAAVRADLKAAAAGIRLLTTAAALCQGFYFHRGQYRRRRMRDPERNMMPEVLPYTPSVTSPATPPDQKPHVPALSCQLQALIAAAGTGAPNKVAELRSWMRTHPEFIDEFFTLQDMICRGYIGLIEGPNVVMGELALAESARVKRELAGRHPDPIERLLIEQVVSTLLGVRAMECAPAVTEGRAALERSKLLEAARRQHTAALKALTQYRHQMAQNVKPQLKLFGADTGT